MQKRTIRTRDTEPSEQNVMFWSLQHVWKGMTEENKAGRGGTMTPRKKMNE